MLHIHDLFMMWLKLLCWSPRPVSYEQQPPLEGAGNSCFCFIIFLFTVEPSSKRLGISIIYSNAQIVRIHHIRWTKILDILIYFGFEVTKTWRIWKQPNVIAATSRMKHQEHAKSTFNASSSKHFSTFSLVFALHSRNKDPSSFARAIPSSLLTALSESWHHIISLLLV